MNKKILALSLALLGFTACSTAKNAQNKGQFTRTLTVTVDSVARVQTKPGQTFLIDQSADNDLRSELDDEKVARALELAGFKKAQDIGKVDFVIHTEYGVEKPVTGISLGMIAPFKHSVIVKAMSQSQKRLWETRISGPSEYEDRRQILPVLLAAALDDFGKTTEAPKRVQIQEQDETVLKIKNP